ncbi:streptococcal hemagglutinin-like [Littorina saxatilis]
MGFVLLLALCIAVGIFIKRRGPTSRHFPPPTPHMFRRRAPDAVMFHVQSAPQNHRDSFISVHDHIYSEIPDEEDATPSDSIVASSNSSSVSDSTFANEHLAAIAFPSSESSELDDDRHFCTSALEISADCVTVHSWPSAPITTSMARSEPPYENMTPTFPEPDNIPPSVVAFPVSNSTSSNDQNASVAINLSENSTSDDHLLSSFSAVEATTDSTTVDSLSSAASLRSEPPYENTLSTLPDPVTNLHSTEASPASDRLFCTAQPAAVAFSLSNNTVHDNHPGTSAEEADTDTVTVRSSRPALTMTTSSTSEPPCENTMPIPREHDNTLPDDYLHPIASADEVATPTPAAKTAGLSAMNSCTASKCEGTLYENTVTLSKKTLNTLPDDYLHPIASPLEAITTVSTKVAVTSETVSTTKIQDKQSCTTEEQK